jgi:ribonuclease HII
MTGFSSLEFDLLAAGWQCIAGLDEAGRGPLAGPVVAAAVVFSPDCRLEGVDDSKALKESAREELADRIRSCALDWAIGACTPEEIDRENILQASIHAMHRAVSGLHGVPAYLLVDGNRFHHPFLPFRTVVHGDATCFSIAAASILAKVERDRIMRELDVSWPAYGFARHKGYPTRAHIEALRLHGPSPVHRRSFTVKALVTTREIFDDDRQTDTGPGG